MRLIMATFKFRFPIQGLRSQKKKRESDNSRNGIFHQPFIESISKQLSFYPAA